MNLLKSLSFSLGFPQEVFSYKIRKPKTLYFSQILVLGILLKKLILKLLLLLLKTIFYHFLKEMINNGKVLWREMLEVEASIKN